jgi:tRNA-dihydrouridine synthase A
MTTPDLVVRSVEKMLSAVDVPVTVKCRIGVDQQDPETVLPDFVSRLAAVGVTRLQIHARKAWLSGLSPKENRDVPPLDYELVYRVKADHPELHLSINGGVLSLDEADGHLRRDMDGVMIGRAAYHEPWSILGRADSRIFGQANPCRSPFDAVEAMRPYVEAHLAAGGRVHSITRHMLGLFAGQPGARAWRRTLSEGAARKDAGVKLLDEALSAMEARAA